MEFLGGGGGEGAGGGGGGGRSAARIGRGAGGEQREKSDSVLFIGVKMGIAAWRCRPARTHALKCTHRYGARARTCRLHAANAIVTCACACACRCSHDEARRTSLSTLAPRVRIGPSRRGSLNHTRVPPVSLPPSPPSWPPSLIGRS